MSRTPTLVALAAALTLSSCTASAAALSEGPDVSLRWNELILEVAEAEDGFLSLKGVRTAAMMHLAMHDALQSLQPRFAHFALAGVPGEGAASAEPVPPDPELAAAEAAYAVAASQYPDRDSVLAAERAYWIGRAEREGEHDPRSISAARRLGGAAAAAILAARTGDGWDRDPQYAFHPMGPGVYAEFHEHSGTPEGFVFGAGWAEARPFVLERPDEFRPPPPPSIESEAYAHAFQEVKELGASESSARTADQAHLALWWKEFVEKSHNRLGRELVASRGLDLWEATRFLALLNMAVFDGYVASFDGKFAYNHWRPYTAIRWAQDDGNPATEADPGWTNLHDHTYAFPSYPSAHGSVCGAAMTVFESVFGGDQPFEMTTREVDQAGPFSPAIPMDPATREFQTFKGAADECGMSRVYLGIHFRYDSEEGVALGRKVGGKVTSEALGER